MTKKTQTKPKLQAAETPTFQRFIGVDPGRDGAIAVVDENGALLYVGDAKSGDNFALDLMRPVLREALANKKAVCAVEKPVAMPGIHGCVLITLTLAAGAAIGAADALGAFVETPTASSWKRSLGLTSDKAQSTLMANQLFGSALPTRCRHDKCEAALLAYWAYKKHNSGT